jgi:hypothetical protein
VRLSFFAWLKKTFAAASARISCKPIAIDISDLGTLQFIAVTLLDPSLRLVAVKMTFEEG